MDTTDRRDVVAQVKAELEQRGIALDGPCGAFEITRRVAWRLRDVGAGLLDKPTGNNCQGFAVDIIAFPDGQIFDVLVASGDENGPTWQPVGVISADRYRAPTDPGDVAAPSGPEALPPIVGAELLPLLRALLELGDRFIATVDVAAVRLASLETRIDTLAKAGIRVHL